MDPASILLNLALVLVLTGINAFFVAAKFSLVVVRRTRMEQRLRSGDRRARHVTAALEEPDGFVSAAQLGVTLASLALGAVAWRLAHAGVASVAPFAAGGPAGYAGPVAAGVAAAGAVALVAGVHLVLGELVPRMISVQSSEQVALRTVPPVRRFAALVRPFLRAAGGLSRAIVRGLGLQPVSVYALAHTPQELQALVEQSHHEGMVEADAEQMIHGVLEFRERIAREIMTPRPDIVAVPVDAGREDVLELIRREGRSRLPVYEGSIDNVVGVLLAKDLLAHLAAGEPDAFDLRSIMREPYFIPDTKRSGELLAELRAGNVHMAVVIDEFGGTEGLVTLEDLLEEIVGDIYDEYDEPEPEFVLTAEGEVLMDGGAGIGEVNERFGLHLPESDYETVGGFILGELGRIPVPGETVPLNGSGLLRVEEMQERRITRVRLVPPSQEEREPSDAAEIAAAPVGAGDGAPAAGGNPVASPDAPPSTVSPATP